MHASGMAAAEPLRAQSPAGAMRWLVIAVLTAALAGCSVAGAPRNNAPPVGSAAPADSGPAPTGEISALQGLDAPATASGAVDSDYADGTGLAGEESFLACAGCHSKDPEDTYHVGPHLAGIVGRLTGAVADYAYSAALSEASFVWDRSALFSWIAAAESLLPGTHMLYHNHLEPDEVFRLIDFLEASGEPQATGR